MPVVTGINWAVLGQFILAIGIGTVIASVVQNIISPKTRAEAKQIAASVAQKTVDQALAALETRAVAAETRAQRAEERADEIGTKYDAVLAQNRIFVEHIWRLSSWINRYYDRVNHPAGMEPPPIIHVEGHPEQ